MINGLKKFPDLRYESRWCQVCIGTNHRYTRTKAITNQVGKRDFWTILYSIVQQGRNVLVSQPSFGESNE